jgi:hypothetical protein
MKKLTLLSNSNNRKRKKKSFKYQKINKISQNHEFFSKKIHIKTTKNRLNRLQYKESKSLPSLIFLKLKPKCPSKKKLKIR